MGSGINFTSVVPCFVERRWAGGTWNHLNGPSGLRGLVEIGGCPGDLPFINTDENTPLQIASAMLLANDEATARCL